MSCIHCYSSSSPLNLITFPKQRHNDAANIINKAACWDLFGYSTKKKHARIIRGISQVGVVPLKVEDFPASFTLATASARPPDIHVLFQTSSLMLLVYLIANFVVPQLLAESLGFDKVDGNEQATPNTYSDGKEEASSSTTKNGSDSTNSK